MKLKAMKAPHDAEACNGFTPWRRRDAEICAQHMTVINAMTDGAW